MVIEQIMTGKMMGLLATTVSRTTETKTVNPPWRYTFVGAPKSPFSGAREKCDGML